MQKNKKNINKKIAILSVFILSSALIATAINQRDSIRDAFFSPSNNKTINEPVETINTDPSSRINMEPSNPSDNDQINKTKENADKPTATIDPSLNATVTYADKINSDTYAIRVLIEGTTTGSCKLTLTKGSEVISKEAAVVLKGNNYSCDGFDVSVNELGAGDWSVAVLVESNGKVSDAGEATLKAL